MSNPVDAVTAVAAAAEKAIDFAKVREERMNTPEMQEAAAAKTDAEIKDDANNAIAKDELDEIRKQAAE